mgnify:CR=1 FL=1
MKAALTMAIIRGIGTIIDAVTDPWVASLSDNSKAKSGRRISFMRWSAIPYGLFCLLIFFPPVAGSSVINAIWVGVMLALYYLFSTLYNIPYSALQAEVVAEPRKRVFLYSIVSLLYVVSSAMVFCTSMIKSILMKNGIEEIWALRIPFIVFCVLGGIAALIQREGLCRAEGISPVHLGCAQGYRLLSELRDNHRGLSHHVDSVHLLQHR